MLDKVIEIAHKAGKIALDAPRDKKVIRKEGKSNFVTEYDKRVEDFLVSELHELMPEADFICEEGAHGAQGNYDGYHFIIDPIDGTTNFIKGSSDFAVCIGLKHTNDYVLGVVYVPTDGVTYYAERNKGAFKLTSDGVKAIHVSSEMLDGAIVACGTSPYRADLRKRFISLTDALFERVGDLRRSGSAAIDICYVAEGVCDAMYECELSAWDHSAANAVLCEAGGVCSDFDGNHLPLEQKSSIICANGLLHKEFIDLIKEKKL